MARFYVGQRVRIIKTFQYPELLNKECTIIGLDEKATMLDGRKYIGIALDCKSPTGRPIAALPEQLEPITDCYDLSTWDQCVWRPEHMRTEA